jgi:hypothetical protein
MHPGALHFHGLIADENALQAVGLAGQREGSQLSLVAARAQETSDGDELQN